MVIKAADMLIARRADTRARADFATWKMMAKLNGTSSLPPEAQTFLASYKALLKQTTEPEATEAARAKLHREASRKQKVLDPRSLIAAEFMILATSLPAAGYPAEEVLAVYRLRWQIELAFKRLKSLLKMDQIPTRTERASRSWLTAHLIMALLCDDISQEFLDSSP